MTYKQAMKAAARDYISAVLEQAGGSALKAAKIAGCNRTHFHSLLTRHGVRRLRPAHRGSWGDLSNHNPQLREVRE